MTTTDTRPSPHTSSQEAAHEHAWATTSRHATSVGFVLYVRCTTCGDHRVDLQGHRETPPAPLSRVVGSGCGVDG
ncbi:hypothetical protein [Promicromonospora iranensis]|uniref:hypothetical protein n=1 Tax=Promicromonospora iranensis TaxID=1105144 RepID=UPI0023A9DD4E|nr:hypothetical protein [Promicromonospora iranensis]